MKTPYAATFVVVCLCWATLFAPTTAQDPPTPAPAAVARIELADPIKGNPNGLNILVVKTNCQDLQFTAIPDTLGVLPGGFLKDPNTTILMGPAGEYTLIVAGNRDGKTVQVKTKVIMGSPTPPGPGPGPAPAPTPGPGPLPVDPFARVDARGAPVEVGAPPMFRVLIVYEQGAIYSKEQQSAMDAAKVRDWLNSHCSKSADGKDVAWRKFDQNVKGLENESPVWARVMKRPRTTLPWIVIGTGTAGYEGPLPATVDATLKLLNDLHGV